jgi:hypothetical protein
MKTVYWALPLATLATCGALVYLMLELIALGGGALPFDLRPMGYGVMDARIYLQHLSPVGAALYQGAFRLTDTLFPILLALTLCLPLGGRGQVWFLPALAYGLCDLAENLAVAQMLQAGPDVAAQAVALASGFTEGKFVTAIVAIVLALFATLQLWRNR